MADDAGAASTAGDAASAAARPSSALLSEEDVAKALAAFAQYDPDRRGIRLCDLKGVFDVMGEGVSEAEVFDVRSPQTRLPFAALPHLFSPPRR